MDNQDQIGNHQVPSCSPISRRRDRDLEGADGNDPGTPIKNIIQYQNVEEYKDEQEPKHGETPQANLVDEMLVEEILKELFDKDINEDIEYLIENVIIGKNRDIKDRK